MKKFLFAILILVSSNIFGQGHQYVVNTTYANPVNTRFSYTVNNTSGQSPEQNINIISYSNSTGWRPSVDWGDGATSVRTSDSLSYTLDHIYTANGTFKNTIYITGDTSFVRQIYFNANTATSTVTAINNITYFSKLDQFKLNNISIASLNNLTYPSTLTRIQVSGDLTLTNFDPVTALPSALSYLQLSGCGGGSLGTGSFPYFHPTIALPPTLTTIILSSNNWDSTAVNNTLVYLNGQTFNSPVTINIKQFNSKSAPTGAGLTAKNALIAKGDILTTD